MKIDNIFLKIIYDSRGQETLKAIMRSGILKLALVCPWEKCWRKRGFCNESIYSSEEI